MLRNIGCRDRVASEETDMKFLKRIHRDIAGATAIEYGLIAALIAVAAITAMQGASGELQATFNTSSSAMAGGNAAA